MKCLSSSITLHLEHSLLLRGVLGLVYLPRSISRGWELDRIFIIAFRYLESFTKSRYVSKWKPFLMFLYNSNLGNLLKFCILDHQCSTKKLIGLFLNSLMTTVGSSMSKLYFSAISLTLLTQVRKPWLWRLYSAMNQWKHQISSWPVTGGFPHKGQFLMWKKFPFHDVTTHWYLDKHSCQLWHCC